MATPQDHQSNKLIRVGTKGFAFLDEIYDSPNKYGGRLSSTSSYDTNRQYPRPRKPVIDSNQAALASEGFDLLEELYGRPKKHGGRLSS